MIRLMLLLVSSMLCYYISGMNLKEDTPSKISEPIPQHPSPKRSNSFRERKKRQPPRPVRPPPSEPL